MGSCNSKYSNNVLIKESSKPTQEMIEKDVSKDPTSSILLDEGCCTCSLSEDAKKQIAISKIQRQARRKRAMKAAKAEQQWRLFAELDTQDEVEMLHLAVFMQTLLDLIPTMNKSNSGEPGDNSAKSSSSSVDRDELMLHLNSDSDSSDPILLGELGPQYSTTTVDLRSSLQKYGSSSSNKQLLHIDSINININCVKLHTIPYIVNAQHEIEYNIIDLKFDYTLLLIVIEIYRQNHKLTRNSIMKILSKGYKLLLEVPNVVHMHIGTRDKLTVVGDLHGQLADLLCIFELSGIPSSHNKYIFNGDFVDRGNKSVEVILLLLLAFCVEGREVVCLNRGNHEDRTVNRVYGFQEEVLTKYPHDHLLLEMFLEVFNHLPLFSVINEDVFVVHGGLFHTPDLTLQDLAQIPRREYILRSPIPYPQILQCSQDVHLHRREFLMQLQREALWSDPFDGLGVHPNDRGLGIKFGKDIAQQFMERNQLSMIIRSHECIYTGFAFPFQPDHILNHQPQTEMMPDNTNNSNITTRERQNSAEDFLSATRCTKSMQRTTSTRSSKHKSNKEKSFANNCDSDDEELACLSPALAVETPPPVAVCVDSTYLRLQSRRSSSQEEVMVAAVPSVFPPLLCTLFSASNYCGGDNFGAIMEFINHDVEGARALLATDCYDLHHTLQDEATAPHHLHYLVKHYKASSDGSNPVVDIQQHNQMSLRELILRKKIPLLTAFQVCDELNEGQVSLSDFSDILIRITNIRIRWLSLLPTLVPASCLLSNAVKYRMFLDHFSLFHSTISSSAVENEVEEDEIVLNSLSEEDEEDVEKDKEKANRMKKMKTLMDNMYGQRRQLETIFFYFDTNGDGVSNTYI